MSSITVRQYDVREYVGSLDDVKAAIIEADANLIGLGLFDLGWHEFLEAVEQHRYSRVEAEWIGRNVRVETWSRVTATIDDDEAVIS